MVVILPANKSCDRDDDGDPGGTVEHKEKLDSVSVEGGGFGERGRHWIKATLAAPGMAFGEATETKPKALQCAVFLYGLKCIGRAAGMETTSTSATAAAREGVQERRNQPAVEMDKVAEQEGHARSRQK